MAYRRNSNRQNNQFKAYGAGRGIRREKGEVRPDAVYLDDLENENTRKHPSARQTD